MKHKMMVAVVLLALSGARARADEGQEEKAESSGGQAPVTIRAQVVFNRYQGEKKVSSFPYSLSMSSDNRPARLRMGINVPLRYESKESQGNVVFKSVGNSVDCSARRVPNNQFSLACTIEQSSVYAAPGESKAAAPAPPVLTNFTSDATLVLRDGQTGLHTIATDPLSGEVLKVEITLNVVK